jgi:hypothetical protein
LNNKLEWSLPYHQEKFGEQAGGKIIQTESKFVLDNLVYSRYSTSNSFIRVIIYYSCFRSKENLL